MPHNEGQLSKHTFGGDKVYTNDHQCLILNGKLKSGHADILEGSVLVFDAGGELDVVGADNTLQIAGVAAEAVPTSDAQKYVSYVAHGTVKAGMLKGANGSAYSDTNKLQTAGVYAL